MSLRNPIGVVNFRDMAAKRMAYTNTSFSVENDSYESTLTLQALCIELLGIYIYLLMQLAVAIQVLQPFCCRLTHAWVEGHTLN